MRPCGLVGAPNLVYALRDDRFCLDLSAVSGCFKAKWFLSPHRTTNRSYGGVEIQGGSVNHYHEGRTRQVQTDSKTTESQLDNTVTVSFSGPWQ